MPENKSTREQELDDELAVLRALITDSAEDPQLVLRAVALVARTVAARHGLSKEHENELYQEMVGKLQGLGLEVPPDSAA